MSIGDKLMDYKRIWKKYTLILRISTVLIIIFPSMVIFRKFHNTVGCFNERRWSSSSIKNLLK